MAHSWADISLELAKTLGPQALEKLKAFFDIGDDPVPGRIKLDFQNGEGTKEVVVWRPERERLHDKFRELGTRAHDFAIKYVDTEGDEMTLTYTKSTITEMFESIREPPRLSILCQATAAGDQTSQRDSSAGASESGPYQRLLQWITGGGATANEDFEAMRAEVGKQGLGVPTGKSGPCFVHWKGVDLDKWPEICGALAKDTKLAAGDVETMRAAQHSDDVRCAYFEDSAQDGARRLQYVAFATAREGDKVHAVYGRHVLEHQLATEKDDCAPFPSENCVKHGTRLFTVLPQAFPHMKGRGFDMKDSPFDIPRGWKIVDASEDGFESVRRHVIGQHDWHTDVIVAQKHGHWPCWKTAQYGGSSAGEVYSDNVRGFKYDAGQSRFEFTSTSCRLLIEQAEQSNPATSFAPLQDWKRYVQLDAQREWSSRLGLAPPKDDL